MGGRTTQRTLGMKKKFTQKFENGKRMKRFFDKLCTLLCHFNTNISFRSCKRLCLSYFFHFYLLCRFHSIYSQDVFVRRKMALLSNYLVFLVFGNFGFRVSCFLFFFFPPLLTLMIGFQIAVSYYTISTKTAIGFLSTDIKGIYFEIIFLSSLLIFSCTIKIITQLIANFKKHANTK
jgi:hypothetical protein